MTFDLFKEILCSIFPQVSEKQVEQFRQMEGLYKEWNSKINVISRKDIEELYSHHIFHSLCIALYIKTQLPDVYAAIEAGEKMKILDLGCGGGFPGIPLATLFPNIEFTLCDSIGKKIKVASGVAEALGLENVKCVNARAESLTDSYDFIVSRAVTSLENFMPWVKGKYSQGILYLKGGDLAEEISIAMSKFKMKKGSVHVYPISKWTDDEFFESKMVIYIER